MQGIRASFRDILRYPSALVGLAIILVLGATKSYAVIKSPYSQASRL